MNALRVLAAAVLLAGCVSLQPRPDETREVASLLADYRRVATLPAEEQRRAAAAAQQSYDKAADDATRLGLAMALLLPHAQTRDDARAQALLAAVTPGSEGAPSPRYDLAQTLLSLIAERQRQAREDQRRLEALGRQAREDRRRSEEMQQKIESLRAIDRDFRRKSQ